MRRVLHASSFAVASIALSFALAPIAVPEQALAQAGGDSQDESSDDEARTGATSRDEDDSGGSGEDSGESGEDSGGSGEDSGESGEGAPAGYAEDPYGDDYDADQAASDDVGLDDEYEPVEDPSRGIGLPRTICQGRRVRRVRVLGNRRVADDDVLATVRTRTGRTCSDAEVADDAQALWELGFFDDIRIEAELVGERVDLIFRIRERPAIAAVRFEGNDHVNDSDIEEVVELREGAIFSHRAMQRQTNRIRDLYAEKSYFLARVTPRLVRQANNEVDVVFDIIEGDEVVVRRVRFVGNRALSGDELRGIMQTQQSSFFSFIANNDGFQEQKFEEDVTRLQAIYYDRGYLTMRTGTPRIELTPDRKFIDITIPVVEGPRFKIGRLRVVELDDAGEETDLYGGRRAVRELVATDTGDWFQRTAVGQSLLAVTRHYRDGGFAHVDVQPETDLDMEHNIVDLSIVIRRGPLTRIERIDIRGNTKTRDSVIRREIRVAEQSTYNQSELERGRAMVEALGYFERVELSESEGSSPDMIVITIEVTERPTGTFNVGAGFSTIETFVLTAQVQQQNLFGNGQSLNLQLQLSGLRQLVQIQFVEPYLFNSQWSGSLDLFRTVRQYQSFTRDSTGAGLSFGHPILDRNLSLFVSYRGDEVRIGPRTLGYGAGQGLSVLNLLPIDNLFRNGFQSTLRLTITYDGRNNRIYPSQGVYASWSTEFSDQYIGSVTDWVRHRATFRWYWEILSGVVLKMNTEWGLITSRTAPGPPMFERFYVGGIYSIRGFPLNGLGPRAAIPRNITAPDGQIRETGETLGGNMQFYNNLELEVPIVQEVGIRGVVFVDVGNAWNTDQYLCGLPSASVNDPASDPCRLSPLDLRASWGFGVRWISPLGPLRFEFGLPFDRRPWEQAIDFQFTIGNFF